MAFMEDADAFDATCKNVNGRKSSSLSNLKKNDAYCTYAP